MTQEAKRVGRPIAKVTGKRSSLGLRVSSTTKKLINQRAKESGRTQSQVAEDMIERCLLYEKTLEAMGTTLQAMEKEGLESALRRKGFTPVRQMIDDKIWKAWYEPGYPGIQPSGFTP